MKLELGCGERPTEGYLHQDIASVNGTKLDFECQPYEIDLPKESLEKIIALGVMEHLTDEQFNKTIFHMFNLMKDEACFIFDVPDMQYWFKYASDYTLGFTTPFDIQHIENTILGWRRFPGDEHKSMWWKDKLDTRLHLLKRKYEKDNENDISFNILVNSMPWSKFLDGIKRNRFDRWETDRHLYVNIIKFRY